MKILKLRFKNLNSLYGRWEIDFTVPEYDSGGIFAITGPTGSGKTTILDALSLALYGETPRLGKISQSTNDTMSRLSSDCFAEVEFESAKGSFCCSFTQKKAGNNPEGKLQGPKHEISDLKTGNIIEDKKSKVAAVVEEVTGMNYDRFKRSIMLAQGDFAVFLNSKPADRAPVLEQITGTEIYTEISVRVHERKKKEQSILDGMQESLRSVKILSAEEESGLKEDLTVLGAESNSVKAKLDGTEKSLRWVENIRFVESEIARLNEEKENIGILREKSSEDLKRLSLYRQALGFKNIYDNLLQNRAKLSDEKKALDELNAALPDLRDKYDNSVSEYNYALKARDTSSRNFDENLEFIKKARKSDIVIEGCLNNLSSVLKNLEELKEKEGSYKAKISRISENISYLESEAGKLRQYLSDNEKLKDLRENIALIEEKARKYLECIREEQELDLKIKKSLEEIADKKRDISGIEEEQSGIKEKLSEFRLKYEEFSDKRDLLLAGRTIKEYYESDRKYSHLLSEIKNALRYFDDIISAEDKLNSFVQEKETDEFSISGLKKRYSELSGRKNEKAEYIGVLEENYALASKIRSLDEERKKLISGKPCPLCGSLQHPYASEIPPSDVQKSKIEAEKSLLEGLSSEMANTISEIAVLESKIKADKKRSDELLSGIKLLRSDLAKCLENGGVEPEGIKREDLLRKAEYYSEELEKIRSVIRDYEPLNEIITSAEKELSLLSDKLSAAEREIQEAEYLLRDQESLKERLSGDLLKIRNDSENLKEALEDEFNSYASGHELPDKKEEIPALLRDILSEYNEKEREYDVSAEKLGLCRTDLEKFSALHADAVTLIGKKSGEEERLNSELGTLKAERFALLGDKNPDEEEGRLKSLVEHSESLLMNKREIKENLNSEVIRLESRKEGLLQRISGLNYETAVLNENFLSKIHAAGFGSEEGFEEALMPEQEAEKIAATEEEIKAGETRVENLLSEKSAILAAEKKKELTDLPEEELRAFHASIAERQREIDRMAGEISGRLKANDEEKGLAFGKLKEIEEQEKVLLRWDKLNELIGSHNGSKFQKFAQGLTFEILVIHANNQLRKMSDRYILVRSESDPLELGIIDNYQAGELRSTKNLSGGESFIVSLALALGLSDMSGSRVRVDSLFLDEGFGTLDENALDIALDTLSGLQHEGKTIGVISHVPALKERISIRIKVEKKSSGRSVITGPGCREMA